MEEAAYFKESDGIGYVRAVGHVTALLCPGLKSRISASLDSPAPPERIAFDLSACEYMDSTFLGLIVGVCKRMGAPKARKVILHGTNEACVGLLRTIGVLGLVELSDRPAPALEGMESVGSGAKATARFILDAHEDLSGLSEENRNRFAALSTALRSAIGERGGEDRR